MRRVACLLLLAPVLAGGCGDEEEPAGAPVRSLPARTPAPVSTLVDPTPTKAALRAQPGPALSAQLDDGAVAVVDLVGRMAIRPGRLQFAKGGELYGLQWRRWDDGGAVGAGTMEGVVCEPSCGQGRLIRAPATIRLSSPVACPGGRFFDRGRIEVDSDDPHAASTSWLAAPC